MKASVLLIRHRANRAPHTIWLRSVNVFPLLTKFIYVKVPTVSATSH